MQTVVGLTGKVTWIRRRVWFWQRKRYEASGWRKSPHEGLIRPMMIYRKWWNDELLAKAMSN